MVWTWHYPGKNYKWTQTEGDFSVTLNSMHANYGPDSDLRYTIGNIEWSAKHWACGTRRCSYVRIRLGRDVRPNLHFRCSRCDKNSNPPEITITLTQLFLMDLADERWDREELMIHLGLIY